MPDFTDFLPLYVRTEDDIRADLDSDANLGLSPDDPQFVDTRQGGFFHLVTQPFVMEAARIHDLIATLPAVGFIPFAFGDYLDYHALSLNTERIAATTASGRATFKGIPGTEITANTQISTEQPDANTPPVVFLTTDTSTITDVLPQPTGLSATVADGGSINGPSERYYVIAAVDIAGETLASNEVHVSIPGGDSNKQVQLDWSLITDADGHQATGYYVYFGAGAGSEDQAVFVDTPGFVDTGSELWTTRAPTAANTTGGAVSIPIQAQPQQAGTIGNVNSNALTQMVTYNNGVISVTNPLAISNGTDVETDPALQKRLLEIQEGAGPGNVADYVQWVSGLAGVGQVFVMPNWRGPGTVGVVIMDVDGNPVDTSLVAYAQQQIDPYPGQGGGIAPIDHIVTIMTPVEVPVDVAASVVFQPGFSYDGISNTVAIRQNIINKLQTYFRGLEVGQTVLVDEIKAQFFQVEGVANLTLTAPAADVAVSVSTDPPERGVMGSTLLT